MGTAITTLRGVYVGSTLAPEWNERVTAGDLGYRSKAVLSPLSPRGSCWNAAAPTDLDSAERDYRGTHWNG